MGVETKKVLAIKPKNSACYTCTVSPDKDHVCARNHSGSSGSMETCGLVEAFNEALLEVSNLPKSRRAITNWEINQGLRVFGWTHAYNIPQLLYWLEKENKTLSK